MIVVKDTTISEIIDFLDLADEHGRNTLTVRPDGGDSRKLELRRQRCQLPLGQWQRPTESSVWQLPSQRQCHLHTEFTKRQ